ncbi:MAG: oligosaccharide flippase family protein [Actinomycetota bacterium]
MASNAGLGPATTPGTRSLWSKLGWSVATQIVVRFTTFGQGVVMAHLLFPKDFGKYAVALSAVAVLLAINDAGIINGIIRWPGALDEVTSTAATVVLAVSVLAFMVAEVFAPQFSTAVGVPSAASVVRLVSLVVVIDALCAVPSALMFRQFRVRARLVAEVTGLFANTVVAVGLALTHHGVFSIAWGRIAGAAVTAGLVIAMSEHRPRPGFDRKIARSLLTFGVPLSAAALLEGVLLNTDYVVIGRHFRDPAMLGAYVLAFNFASWPVNMLTQSVNRISIPAFASLQDKRVELQRALSRALALMVVPAGISAVVLSLLARPAVRVVYGAKWAHAIGPLRVLAFVGAIRVIINLSQDALVALGHSRDALRLKVIWFVVLVPLLIIGVKIDSLRGVGLAHLAVAGLIVLPITLRLLVVRAGVDLMDVARQATRPILAGVVSWVISAALLVRTEWGPTWSLVSVMFLTLVTYAVIVGPQFRSLLGRSAMPAVAVDEPPYAGPVADDALDATPLTDRG